MIIIPAIDIKAGKVVRLVQGKFDRETVYSDSPVDVAKRWDSFGVDMIHIVDLDGAREGRAVNMAVAGRIAGAVKARVELGGGIRDEESIKAAIGAGISKVVVGTKALDEEFLDVMVPRYESVIVGVIDACRGLVRVAGWLFNTKVNAMELAKRLQDAGVRRINYTDISKDGMLKGPNLKSLKELIASTKMDVIAAGGVSSIEDLRRLKELERDGLKGIIIGKALYEGRVDLAEAMGVCR